MSTRLKRRIAGLELDRDEAREGWQIALKERDEWCERAAKSLDRFEQATAALTQLRDAWNAHMATCPPPGRSESYALPSPTLEEIESWKNAPSDTASGGSS